MDGVHFQQVHKMVISLHFGLQLSLLLPCAGNAESEKWAGPAG